MIELKLTETQFKNLFDTFTIGAIAKWSWNDIQNIAQKPDEEMTIFMQRLAALHYPETVAKSEQHDIAYNADYHDKMQDILIAAIDYMLNQ